MVEGVDTENCHGLLLVMEAAWWYVPNGVNDASGNWDTAGDGGRGGL